MPEKIIALLGSPVRGGNTAYLFNKAVKGAEAEGCEVEKVMVPSLNFQPCMEILHCMAHEDCQMQDDLTPYYQKFREMDGLIIATPIMTMGIPGKLKSFMDRFQVFYMAKYMRNNSFITPEHRARRKTLFICISGMDLPDNFAGALQTTRAFCEIIDCPYWDGVFQRDMDHVRDIRTRPEVVEAAYEKGKELCRLVRRED
ncbi:flavodoxin family protein [Methanofollis aquaemaris]|uniref:Flavodoxin family protein n=1 Tax=Methanofollis aquaemaris TaxID=126734 RepID=A0A8A3S609_9EURY|nr:flavodoxin family protein [Methanofollis aquaemaris]QSZ67588.1 flavodoxin family protein [Methanofollis aquaemaris]